METETKPATQENPLEILVDTTTDQFVLKGRPCEVSAFSFIPTERAHEPERTYFNVNKVDRKKAPCTYDRLFHATHGFNMKLHRDDREHAKLLDLDVNSEECVKTVPNRSSTEYGLRWTQSIDPPQRLHGHVAIVKEQFFRRNGAGLKSRKTLKDLCLKHNRLGLGSWEDKDM